MNDFLMSDFLSGYIIALTIEVVAVVILASVFIVWLKSGVYGVISYVLAFGLPAVAAWVLS